MDVTVELLTMLAKTIGVGGTIALVMFYVLVVLVKENTAALTGLTVVIESLRQDLRDAGKVR
jgi:hypothetical protein